MRYARARTVTLPLYFEKSDSATSIGSRNCAASCFIFWLRKTFLFRSASLLYSVFGLGLGSKQRGCVCQPCMHKFVQNPSYMLSACQRRHTSPSPESVLGQFTYENTLSNISWGRRFPADSARFGSRFPSAAATAARASGSGGAQNCCVGLKMICRDVIFLRSTPSMHTSCLPIPFALHTFQRVGKSYAIHDERGVIPLP